MSDIVDRLRFTAANQVLCNKAADEITSLRARLAEAERIRADDVATVRLLQEQLRIGNDALTKTRLRLAELLCEEDMLLALEKSNMNDR